MLLQVSPMKNQFSKIAVCFLMCMGFGTMLSAKTPSAMDGVVHKPVFDPSAEKVELFTGIEQGKYDYKLIMKNSKTGKFILENKTDEALTVELPPAVVAVQVFPQTMNQIQGGGGGGMMGGGGAGGGGGQQSAGGGMGGGGGGGGMMGGGGGGGMGGGGGFFSIPAGKKIALTMNTVCLEHGKPEPSPGATYKIVKVDDYTKDQNLRELINMVGTGKLNSNVAQACAWHIASGKSWEFLAREGVDTLTGPNGIPTFTYAELQAAINVTAIAKGQAREVLANNSQTNEANKTPTTTAVPRTSRMKTN
jgi:hypothetical protein